MRNYIIAIFFFLTIIVGCKYDVIDIKYSVEGDYSCSVYNFEMDTTGNFYTAFYGYDTISIHALEGDSAISFELNGEYYERKLELFDDVLTAILSYGHKMVYFFPPDSLIYYYKPGLGPYSYTYYGSKM